MTIALSGAPLAELPLRALIRSRLLLGVLALLLLVDAGFLAAHAGQVIAEWRGLIAPGAARFSIEAEGGPSEIYEGAKAGVCVLALVIVAWRESQPSMRALRGRLRAGVGGQCLALHERWGAAVRALLRWPRGGARRAGRSPSPGAGLVILAALVLGFRAARRAPAPWAAFVGLLLALGGFAVVVDLVACCGGGSRAGLRPAVRPGGGWRGDGGALAGLRAGDRPAGGAARAVRRLRIPRRRRARRFPPACSPGRAPRCGGGSGRSAG